MTSDIALRQDVLDALEFEPSIDAADIGAAVEDGVVMLTGHVATLSQRSRSKTSFDGSGVLKASRGRAMFGHSASNKDIHLDGLCLDFRISLQASSMRFFRP